MEAEEKHRSDKALFRQVPGNADKADAYPGIAALRKKHLQWRHGLSNVAYIALMHAGLVAWVWLAPYLVSNSAYLALSIIVCLLHQRFLSEWFHEATHWNLLPDRGWNDWIANLMIGSFQGTRVSSNRPGHFRHHATKEFFVAGDPDTRDYAAATRRELIRGVLRDLMGGTALKMFLGRAATDTANGLWFVWLLALHAAGFGLALYTARVEIYPVYYLTLLTLYPVVNRLRLYAQHAWFEENGRVSLVGSRASRSFHSGLLEQAFLQSPLMMYHHEHHAFPSLPYRALREIVPRSGNPNVLGRSSFGAAVSVLGELR